MSRAPFLALSLLLVACARGRDDSPLPNAGSGGLMVDPGSACLPEPGVDADGDGFSYGEDCNDCNPRINAGAYDFPGDGIDDDCSGEADDEPATCDAELGPATSDAFEAARALGLCRRASSQGHTERDWGVLAARFVLPGGEEAPEPLSFGVLDHFGVNVPLEGQRVLALSTGTARDPQMEGYRDIIGFKKGYQSGTPAGYPKESRACPGIKSGAAYDGAALELTLRVPSNVNRLEVSENFFTLEFPGYICSKYNDFFVIDLSPPVPDYEDGNIAFDADNNPISVNNALLQVCEPGRAGKKDFACPLGPSSLEGTGFDTVSDEFSPAPHAATGWLETRAPVTPGSTITLLFAIWDSADGNLDSTVLVDAFRWSQDGEPGTVPVPR